MLPRPASMSMATLSYFSNIRANAKIRISCRHHPCLTMSMATERGKVYPTEIHLLKKEIEVQGDLLNQECLERKADIDRLRLELNTLKELFEQIHPGFQKRLEEVYEQEKQTWDPELEKKQG